MSKLAVHDRGGIWPATVWWELDERKQLAELKLVDAGLPRYYLEIPLPMIKALYGARP